MTTTLTLANPLDAGDAQKLGLTARAYSIGEQIAVEDWAAKALIRTGYGTATPPTSVTTLIGDGPPYPGLGAPGVYYLDRLAQILWGPKQPDGSWPTALAPGRSIASTTVNSSGHLIVTYSDGATVDSGIVRGPTGIVTLTRAQYTALTPKDPTAIYAVIG